MRELPFEQPILFSPKITGLICFHCNHLPKKFLHLTKFSEKRMYIRDRGCDYRQWWEKIYVKQDGKCHDCHKKPQKLRLIRKNTGKPAFLLCWRCYNKRTLASGTPRLAHKAPKNKKILTPKQEDMRQILSHFPKWMQRLALENPYIRAEAEGRGVEYIPTWEA
jgi:hypothetical protein